MYCSYYLNFFNVNSKSAKNTKMQSVWTFLGDINASVKKDIMEMTLHLVNSPMNASLEFTNVITGPLVSIRSRVTNVTARMASKVTDGRAGTSTNAVIR